MGLKQKLEEKIKELNQCGDDYKKTLKDFISLKKRNTLLAKLPDILKEKDGEIKLLKEEARKREHALCVANDETDKAQPRIAVRDDTIKELRREIKEYQQAAEQHHKALTASNNLMVQYKNRAHNNGHELLEALTLIDKLSDNLRVAKDSVGWLGKTFCKKLLWGVNICIRNIWDWRLPPSSA